MRGALAGLKVIEVAAMGPVPFAAMVLADMGASITRIATATGLQKSSLYHRFPGGKQQMADEVARAVGERFAAHVLAPAAADAPLSERIAAIAANLDRFYDGGRRSCILDVLTIGDAGVSTAVTIAGVTHAWLSLFADLALEAGARPAAARAAAEESVAAIEGALVLSRATRDAAPFRRALDGLERRLLFHS